MKRKEKLLIQSNTTQVPTIPISYAFRHSSNKKEKGKKKYLHLIMWAEVVGSGFSSRIWIK